MSIALPTISYPLTIYYDGSCPLCTREMFFLKTYDHEAKLLLVDCSPDGFATVENHTQADMMELIHARDANGQWLIGVAVFIAAYQGSGFSTMAKLWSAPLLRPLWDGIYPYIARHRQQLSRLGLAHVFTWVNQLILQKVAHRTNQKSHQCRNGQCEHM